MWCSHGVLSEWRKEGGGSAPRRVRAISNSGWSSSPQPWDRWPESR
jgi:hypothetical protein